MTKLEICRIEDVNPGQVYLFPEGSFYKAYQKSAWLLCTRVHPFKVSARPLKGLDGLLLSVILLGQDIQSSWFSANR